MSELPQPDLMDQSGRMKRLVLALIVAAACGAVAYVICDQLAQPDNMAGGFDGGQQARAYKFVFYVVGFVVAGAFAVTLKIANARADKKYKEQLLAQAKVVKS
jgi:drug/metabolite transporter (DMT)-like permease